MASTRTKVKPAPESKLWHVSKERLEKPNRRILDQTFQVIQNTDVDVITDRIAKVNKEMSVFAKYDNKKAMAILQTSDPVEMVIKLYNTGKKAKPPGILVEVQRRSGCSVLFHKYSRLVLSAAAGELDYTEIPSILALLPVLNELPCEDGKQRENAIEALNLTKKLIYKDGFDAQYLGIQSLCHMTTINSTREIAALMTSRAVLCGGDEEYRQDIHEKVFDIMRRWDAAKELVSSVEEDEDNFSCNIEHDSILRSKALLVFSNSLNVIFTKGDQEDSQKVYDIFKESNIFDSLCEVLKCSNIRPHDAMLSAKSLSFLIKAYPELRNEARIFDLKPLVDDASIFGNRCHAALARESEELLAIL